MTTNGEDISGISLDALARRAMSLSDELEAAWSSGLEADKLEQAHQALNTEWSGFMTALHDGMRKLADELEAAGVDARFYDWPLSRQTLNNLVADPDPQTDIRQLQLAQALALEDLAKAIGALQQISEGVSGSRDQGRAWNSGGFALIRRRAMLVLRLTRLVDARRRHLVGGPELPRGSGARHVARERLELALEARAAGDPEGACLHLHAALSALVVGSAGDVLAKVPSLARWGKALVLLDEAVAGLAIGDTDLGVLVPLANGLIPMASELVRDPPTIELREALDGESMDRA